MPNGYEADPGWYKHPEGTLAMLAKAEDLHRDGIDVSMAKGAAPMMPGMQHGAGSHPMTMPMPVSSPSAAATHETAGNTLYTCVMHPEVVQDHPGNCPRCRGGWRSSSHPSRGCLTASSKGKLAAESVQAAEGWLSLGMAQAAWQELEAVGSADRRDPIVFHQHARVLVGLGRLGEAKEAVRRAAKLAPNRRLALMDTAALEPVFL